MDAHRQATPKKSRELTPRDLAPFAVLLALGMPLGACSSNSKPKALPPVTMAPTPPEVAEPISNAPQEGEPEQIPAAAERGETAASPAPVVEPVGSGESETPLTTKVIEPARQEAAEPLTLYEAAQREKVRRAEAGESSIVLDDKTLKKYSKGNLTYLEEPEGEESAGGEGGPPEGEDGADDDETAAGEDPEAAESSAEAASESAGDEEYWRERVLDLRIAWRDALDRAGELEDEIARLRHDFYAEDDPFYRDSQIKPAWDQAIRDLEQSQRAAERHQADLERALLEGHREGALPGWLREGIELEPTPEELAEEGAEGEPGEFHEPSEPRVADEDGPDGR